MSLFKKKCLYCGKKINKGEEILKDIKIPGFIGTKEKVFCCSEHINAYEKEVKEHCKKSSSREGCCG